MRRSTVLSLPLCLYSMVGESHKETPTHYRMGNERHIPLIKLATATLAVLALATLSNMLQIRLVPFNRIAQGSQGK
jgi:hypothetical protein